MGKCKICEKQRKFLSRKGYCDPCGNNIRNAVVSQIKSGEGKYFEKWKEGLLKSLEGKSSKNELTAKRKQRPPAKSIKKI